MAFSVCFFQHVEGWVEVCGFGAAQLDLCMCFGVQAFPGLGASHSSHRDKKGSVRHFLELPYLPCCVTALCHSFLESAIMARSGVTLFKDVALRHRAVSPKPKALHP